MIKAYEIKYYVFGKGDRTNWYIFPKGEMPDPAELEGSTIEIRYDDESPSFYDAVGEIKPRGEERPSRPLSSAFRFRIQF